MWLYVLELTLSCLSLLLLKLMCWNLIQWNMLSQNGSLHITGGKMIYIFDSVIPTGDTASVIFLCGLSDKIILYYTPRAGRWSVMHPTTLNVMLSFVCLCISVCVCMCLSGELSAVSQEDPEDNKKQFAVFEKWCKCIVQMTKYC